MSPGLAFREAIFRLSLRAGFLEKRENWRTPFTFLLSLGDSPYTLRRKCWPPAQVYPPSFDALIVNSRFSRYMKGLSGSKLSLNASLA